MLHLQPINFDEACRFIKEYHRHHTVPVGWKFGIAVNNGNKVVGVITVGRPVSRHMDDGWTLEVNRCCTDGTKNACSKLYSAASRAARALGYRKLITYTLLDEPGTSLVAAGWKKIWETAGGTWDCKARPRVQKAPTGQKVLWADAALEEPEEDPDDAYNRDNPHWKELQDQREWDKRRHS